MLFPRENLVKLVSGTLAFSVLLITLCLCTIFFVPETEITNDTEHIFQKETASEMAQEENLESLFFAPETDTFVIEAKKKEDTGLVLYKQPESRAAVEWYYSKVTNNRDISQAILENAAKYNVPLSLAFALAHTESRYKITAIHRNTNGSIDRGLFQLNSQSFPKLTEEDFYDPKVSAYYGLSHLKYCLNTAGNEIAALAMYNAGSNKVKRNNTPQTTLNYISEIQSYRNMLEENFAQEVLALYNVNSKNNLLAQIR